MKSNKKNAIIAGALFGVTMSCLYVLQVGLQAGLVRGTLAGGLFGILIYLFVNSKLVKQQTQIVISDGEDALADGAANHFINNESVGGRLFLLTDKLYFKSHKYNIQNHELQIPLDRVSTVKFYNIFGIIPTGLQVITDNGTVEKFVVNSRSEWRAKILAAKG